MAGVNARPVGRPPRHAPEALLLLVVTEFNTRGYDATSMADLARAVGLTKSSLYQHASGKQELLRRGVARGLEALFAVLDEPAARRGPAVQRVEHVLRRSVQVLAEELPYVTLLLRVRGNTEAERWALARRRELDRRVAELVALAVVEGSLAADTDPRLVTRLIFGAVNGLIEWYRPDGEDTAEQIGDTLVRLTLHGLRAAP